MHLMSPGKNKAAELVTRHPMKAAHAFALVLLGLGATTLGAATLPEYKTTILNVESVSLAGFPTAMNDSGLVVGYFSGNSGDHAAAWFTGSDGSGHAGARLQEPAGTSFSAAYAVNSGGLIAGHFNTGNKNHACIWQGQNGALTPLSEPAAMGIIGSVAHAVNDAGLVAGEITDASGTSTRACTWQGSGDPVLLPLPENATSSSALGMNETGLIVGNFTDASGLHGCAWQDGVPLNPAGLDQSADVAGVSALAANSAGLIVGSFVAPAIHGCTWLRSNAGSAIAVLSDLTAGGSSDVTALNESGVIVGYSLTANALTAACAWLDGVPFRLPVPKNAIHSFANAINKRGQVAGYVVATDAENGVFYQPYVLTPVAPPPPPARPTVLIKGKKKITTAKATLAIKGSAGGAVTSVAYRVGKMRAYKTAKGTAAWKFQAKLRPGRNKILVIARGPGGDSAPAKLTVIRKR